MSIKIAVISIVHSNRDMFAALLTPIPALFLVFLCKVDFFSPGSVHILRPLLYIHI